MHYVDMIRNRPQRTVRRRWLLPVGLALLTVAGLLHAGSAFREREKQLRTDLRETVSRTFPEQAADIRAAFGLKPFDPPPGLPASALPVAPVTVLIHGLDDPGKIWMNLAPALAGRGVPVWVMTYPNDQPIVDSAKLLHDELSALRQREVSAIAIVAHSMGGLVAREMLTNPAWAYPAKVHSGDLPRVTRLIMVGTPNHGSELARFRLLTEFRDQLTHLFQNDYHWLQGIIDGAGEAGIDLLPGSRFLETLNRRPYPAEVEMLVIAGVMSPWQAEEIDGFIQTLQTALPENTHDALARAGRLVQAMANGIGDGLVTVESARLAGVPLRIVPGTHLSIIRNVLRDSRRTPPAVPVIVEQLLGAPPADPP